MRKSLLVMVVFISFSCQASDYFVNPKINAQQRYETNLFLRKNPRQDNWVSTLSPGLDVGLRSETGSLISNFTWNHLFYLNQSELNIDEQLFSVDYAQKNERFQWDFGASYNNQAFINTINTGTVIGDPRFDTEVNIMSKRLSLTPSVTYTIDEQNKLSLNYSYQDVTYDKNKSFLIQDYNYHQALISYNYLFTEVDNLNVVLSGSRFNSILPTFEQTTFNYVAQIGWQHSFNERLSAYVSGGLNYSQIESTQQIPARCLLNISIISCPSFLIIPASTDTTKNENVGKVFSASVQKSFEKGSVSLGASQNQTPTSQGLLTQTQLGFNMNFALNERLTSGLSTNYSTYESTGQINRSLNRTYYSIIPTINWKLSTEINVGLSYTFREQSFTENNLTSQGNTVQLQFSYQPELNKQVK